MALWGILLAGGASTSAGWSTVAQNAAPTLLGVLVGGAITIGGQYLLERRRMDHEREREERQHAIRRIERFHEVLSRVYQTGVELEQRVNARASGEPITAVTHLSSIGEAYGLIIGYRPDLRQQADHLKNQLEEMLEVDRESHSRWAEQRLAREILELHAARCKAGDESAQLELVQLQGVVREKEQDLESCRESASFVFLGLSSTVWKLFGELTGPGSAPPSK